MNGENLFVGNKLTRGEAFLSDGTLIDLTRIAAPVVVFASYGDNITRLRWPMLSCRDFRFRSGCQQTARADRLGGQNDRVAGARAL
jgi:poly(3-hydroxyalkanoate) synthetase